MQERRLRLGETLDDYCPREKRLTNHAVVALVGDEVRTTRCSTCDHEHVYKQGKVPVRRKKAEPQAALYKTVLENITGKDTETGAPLPPPDDDVSPVMAPPPRVITPPPVAAAPVAPVVAAPPEPEPHEPPREESAGHRHTLMRAKLPKIEGQVPERKPTDFTLWNVARRPQGRGRPRPQAAGGGNTNGNVSWGGYSPYANGHPSGKGPQGDGGQPGKGRQNHRRGR